MSDDDAFVDMEPSFLRTPVLSDVARVRLRERFRAEFEAGLEASIDRLARLPSTAVPPGPHVALLREARELYRLGYFYSCVAACGITAERIIKDILACRLRVETSEGPTGLVPDAVEALERFEYTNIVKFLCAANVISAECRKVAIKLAELRNKYAHAAGENATVDALQALQWLERLAEGTISLFPRPEQQG